MKTKPSPASENERFTKALASVLSADPKKIRDKEAQAKSEKPSPHTKYKYVPGKYFITNELRPNISQ
jgi:hypothetical protein